MTVSTEDLARELWRAALDGDDQAAKGALARGADPNASYGTGFGILQLAAENGHRAVVRTLHRAGADPKLTRQFERPALIAAVRKGQDEIARDLLEAGADPN